MPARAARAASSSSSSTFLATALSARAATTSAAAASTCACKSWRQFARHPRSADFSTTAVSAADLAAIAAASRGDVSGPSRGVLRLHRRVCWPWRRHRQPTEAEPASPRVGPGCVPRSVATRNLRRLPVPHRSARRSRIARHAMQRRSQGRPWPGRQRARSATERRMTHSHQQTRCDACATQPIIATPIRPDPMRMRLRIAAPLSLGLRQSLNGVLVHVGKAVVAEVLGDEPCPRLEGGEQRKFSWSVRTARRRRCFSVCCVLRSRLARWSRDLRCSSLPGASPMIFAKLSTSASLLISSSPAARRSEPLSTARRFPLRLCDPSRLPCGRS